MGGPRTRSSRPSYAPSCGCARRDRSIAESRRPAGSPPPPTSWPWRAETGFFQRFLREAETGALSNATVSGSASKLEISLGGLPVTLELGGAIEKLRAIDVAGHFDVSGKTLRFDKAVIKEAALVLDAAVRRGWTFQSCPSVTNNDRRGDPRYAINADELAQTLLESLAKYEGKTTALPYLRYLLREPMDAVIMGRSAVIPVRVPRPARLAWHTMLVSELRNRTSDKKQKDIDQATVLTAILAEREPGALEEAYIALPRSARKHVKAAGRRVLDRLEEAGQDRAADLLHGLRLP